MSYVSPQGNIYLLSGVPLDNTYDHTIYFATKEAQRTYFASKTMYTFTRQYYTRKGNGVIRIQKRLEDLYNCNYMMFQNDGFLPQGYTCKWFYAFITDVEYVNNEVSDVYFEIDVMQTWFYAPGNIDNDYNLEECFVEREHSISDEIGENTIPEPFEVGDYVVEKTDYFKYTPTGQVSEQSVLNGKYSVIIAAPWIVSYFNYDAILGEYKPVIDELYGVFYGNEFSGLVYNIFDLDDSSTPNTNIPDAQHRFEVRYGYQGLISTLTWADEKYKNEIVAIYVVPKNFTTFASLAPGSEIANNEIYVNKEINWVYRIGNTNTTPKNKKLYTYPFNMLYVTSSDGTHIEYKYERFKETQSNPHKCHFIIAGTMGCPPEIKLIPYSYMYSNYAEAQQQSDVLNNNEGLILKNFPMCSWVTDTYRAWVAQNLGKELVSVATNIGQFALSTAIGTPLAMAYSGVNLVSGIANTLADFHKASLMPNDTHGVSDAALGTSISELGFRYYCLRVKDENAKIFDDFFNRFGYATKATKIPNINVRPEWCYTKTKGCAITGTIPTTDTRKICSIYDNGITFWKNPAHVGQYSQYDNSPTS